MRRFTTLLSLTATLAASPLLAQTLPSPAYAPPAVSPPRYSMDDTMRAVQHLFMRRTRNADGWASGGAVLVVNGMVGKALQTRRTPEWRRQKSGDDLFFGSLMLGYGLWKMARFGPEQCEAVLSAYEQGEPLPPYVRRRLKPKFFRYRS